MSPTVEAAIAEFIAALTPVALAPSGELGYGRDLSCREDLQDDFSEVSGDSPEIICEAVLRRFQCTRGGLPDDDDYGLDLAARCNAPMTLVAQRELQSQCVGEAMKDERVGTASLVLTHSFAEKSLTLSGRITPRNPRLNPFSFVFGATNEGVLLKAFAKET